MMLFFHKLSAALQFLRLSNKANLSRKYCGRNNASIEDWLQNSTQYGSRLGTGEKQA